MSMQFESEQDLMQEQGQVVHKIVIPAPADDNKEDADLEREVWQAEAQESATEEEDLTAENFFDFSGGTSRAPKNKTKPAVKANTSKAVKPKDPEKKYGSDFVICYARERIEMPAGEDLTLEQVRQWLETDFPEFGKERTEMLVDEDQKFIVPILKSPKKG
ncbi:hypothetical protein SAMN02799624_05275 [Paenibacillus sp. UNC496MF]|uniref:hypothetical protein n=1 Tax=Paenibacillus sp. UNC496MF TaxID=1502753 RepID=UPI0008DEADD7|nr:hypothetical protein [Paenibacillus sp. UNC496MF]SFJ63336.1 hypothetical protein SAMN02799624_05275 [Paenibacillus sp. UNC496MF]